MVWSISAIESVRTGDTVSLSGRFERRELGLLSGFMVQCLKVGNPESSEGGLNNWVAKEEKQVGRRNASHCHGIMM